MTAWIILLTLAVCLLVFHHVSQARRDGRWEKKIDALVAGFGHLEHIVRGAIQQRTGIDRDIADHESRIRKLEEWHREVERKETGS